MKEQKMHIGRNAGIVGNRGHAFPHPTRKTGWCRPRAEANTIPSGGQMIWLRRIECSKQ